ncbi:MAG: ERAP1-like C-terminal domain-containing protein, partial [Myxococcales bacterium]|nr:ERAP1-like C-terminal domain-containing protein [Myxococcales bacterium]
IELKSPLHHIWLHGQNLEILEARVERTGEAPRSARWRAVGQRGVAALELANALPPGPATIVLRYRAAFATDLAALYRVEVDGNHYAATQFEAIEARRAFPCFDEPSFKTPFDVTMTVAADHVSVANTPVAFEEALPDGRRRIRYATTKPLPTYLVAWLVGPFDVREGAMPAAGPRQRSIPFRGLAARGRGDELSYAIEHTPALLEALERYFDTPYPFEKIDLIAVPETRASGMENVGAITFSESVLLVDPETAPEWQLRYFARVMTHELAHSWFGNLVTMPWWDDLWLNEAFATWIAYRVVSETYPDYAYGVALLQSAQWAMDQDSLDSARQIRQPIESTHDIANAFNSITYQKGAGVIAMLERWLGADTFRDGIRVYIAENAYGNATTRDLTQALSKVSGRDVETPFESFLTQPGVPLLTTTLICDTQGSRLEVDQSRYRPIGSEYTASAAWQVPGCARYAVSAEPKERCALITETHASLALTSEGCPDWVLPNADGAGYYHWTASSSGQQRLLTRGWAALNARERLAALNSATASFYAGLVGPDALLPIIEAAAASEERSVIEASMRHLAYLIDYLAVGDSRESARRFARSLFAPQLVRLGMDPVETDTGERRLLRVSLLRFLALDAHDDAVREKLAAQGREFAGVDAKAHANALDPDLAGLALALAVQDIGNEVFAALEQRLGETQDAVERWRILRALGASRDPGGAERARELALDASLRMDEVAVIPFAQMQYRELRDDTWNWLRDQFPRIVERVGTYNASWLPEVAEYFCDDARAKEVEQFFETRIDEIEGGGRSLASAIETIRLCAALVHFQGAATRSTLEDRAAHLPPDQVLRGGK